MALGFLYNRYKQLQDGDEEQASYAMVQNYLINENMEILNFDSVVNIIMNKLRIKI
jgi:hypothetical protein